MKPLFNYDQFKQSKPYDLLPCECYHCQKIFYISKHQVQRAINPNQQRHNRGQYCSNDCKYSSHTLKITVNCNNCGKEFQKRQDQFKKTKNHFCSKSCAATYNNTHKTKGYRRSKLEIYIEKELNLIYPDLSMDFNKTNTINSELDVYIPSLKLAFELNGIFHYEPIYGQDQLDKIQNNDNRKFQACIEKGIELCIIDISSQKYFKEQTSKKFLNIIVSIINQKLVDKERIELS